MSVARPHGEFTQAYRKDTKGLQVVGTTRSPSKAPSGELQLVEMNVTSTASVAAGVESAMEILGGVDVLINNAGISHISPFEDTPEEWGRKIMETNFFGVVRVTREVLPVMRKQSGGLIINVGSLAGVLGIPYQSYYVASKFALEGFTESLRLELGGLGIRLVVIEPGHFHTEINQNRSVLDSVTPCYQKGYTALKEKVESTMDQAESPEGVARLVYELIRKKKPAIRYPIGKGAGAISFAVRQLPSRIVERVLRGYFRQP